MPQIMGVRVPSRHLSAGLHMGCGAAFLLAGYEAVRSSTNTLFKQYYGAENLPLVMALLPVGLALVLYLYGITLSRYGARKTLFLSTVASAMLVAAATWGIQAGFPIFAAFLYIFRQAYVVLIIEQYWSFVNSTLNPSSAKVLNGPIVGISSIGAIVGGLLLLWSAEKLGTPAMLLMGAALTLPAAFFADRGYAKCGEPRPSANEAKGKRGQLGLHLFRSQPLLRRILIIVLLTQVVVAALELQFQSILQSTIPNPDRQTAYSGGYFALLNSVALACQFGLAPFALRYFSLRLIQSLLPLAQIALALATLFSPTLGVVGASFLIFKAFDYSLFRASKEVFFIPFSYDTRFRAKEVIDVFAYRIGKGGASFMITLAQKLALPVYAALPFLALGASAAWFWVTRGLPIEKRS